jgi:cytochrome c oxidase subunit 1
MSTVSPSAQHGHEHAETPKYSFMQLLVPSYVTGVILGVIGFVLGNWFVLTFIWKGVDSAHDPSGPNFTEQGLVIGYILALVGWLIGIGAFKYPITWLFGLKEPDHQEELRLAGAGQGWARYFRFTTDHKVVGIQYLVAVLIMLSFGGLGAFLMRSDLAQPGSRLFSTSTYNTIVTMHGLLMILTTTTFFIGPFGNFVVPIMIGARDMAFPRLNALSWALLFPGLVIFLSVPFYGMGQASGLGGGVQTGWTFYGPIADQTGIGATALAVGTILMGSSSLLGAVNLITTIVTMRAPGMRWTRMPMTVWGAFGTTVLLATATASFTAALMMVVLDRVWNTQFFVSTGGGDPAGTFQGGGSAWLYQNLFWFFGHPEVYIIVLPAFGIVMDLFAVFSRKPLYGYKTGVLGIMGVAVLSFLVWQHHEFVSGWAPELRFWYMATTEMISVPTGFVFLVGIATMWRGRIWLTVPMAFAISLLWNFVIGGLTGIYLSDVPADIQLHGGFFVVAHFHYTIVGGALMGFFAAVFYWFPKMTGRMMDDRLGWISFWMIQIGFNGAFMTMFVLGLMGMPRRVADYDPIFATPNLIATIFAYVLIAGVAVYFYNIVSSWIAGEKAVANPWGALSLEWQVPTPVPLENFEEIPVITSGPYNFGAPAAVSPGYQQPAAGGSAV